MKKITQLIFLLCCGISFSQNTVTGTVTDTSDLPLAFVNVIEKGTSNGLITSEDGSFTINVADNAILVFSYIGYTTEEIPINGQSYIEVTLSEGEELSTIMLVGSRSPKRTAINTAVPIDVIDFENNIVQLGKVEINELLQYAAPSFNASKQSGSDGADHIDPASLRGLGPDQTLVLINGKRRHQSSLINVFGTRGRGNTGTDLNAIPATSIKRIEVLRDGAAAQYGSDAIAGVINIVLKDDVDELNGSISYGAYSTNADVDTSAFADGAYGLWNTDGYRLDTHQDGNAIGEDKSFDGGSFKLGANYGFGIGEKGGFANFTTEYINKKKTLRPTFDFRKGFGEAAIEGFNFFGNVGIPVSDNTEVYAFGGRNYRDTDAYAFTRNDGARVVTSIYPNGYTPRITSIILDNSVSAGVRTKTGSGWNVDISNTYGKNNFHYYIKGTLNASLQGASPTDFDAGGHSLSQNTLNADFSKYYDDVLSGMNLAFGAEYRTERFTIFAGEEGSYGTYDVNGILITDPTTQTQPIDPDSGDVRAGGSQGFPGYGPANEVDRSRSNGSLYADGEFDLTDAFLVSVAARYENYSDFGGTLNGKLATRYKVSDNMNLRGSLSSGFRAPSLAQIYYNLRFTNFIGGVASDQLLSPNNSPVTKSFGIGALQEEKSLNAGLGFTANFSKFTATADLYYIDVKDRIVLTGTFAAPSLPNVDSAQFFANGADTETTGLDLVLTYKETFNDNHIGISLLANFNNMVIKDVKNGALDEQTFFGERDKAFLLASAPESKITAMINYNRSKFNAGLNITRFAEVALIDFQAFEDPADYGGFDNQIIAATDTYTAKIVTDLNLGYELSDNLKLNVGANNLFNVYPDQQDDWTEGGGYWDSVQMGFGGAYFYSRINYNF
ncbi:TonB-dependent receptor [Ulvibacter litoralis]|uniref:Iron complex outermembrane recepter protein n=1 Tax=Ulvibacter litoralis TaxID=227084 RepID=A0A1G7FAA4_9FLAO|nr:TonB-dependent receptor [Ulvibacter litoralis]GHC52012.1 TonB-dependent receptor [Ulvibacter litoralis]SDE72811.1 iron complex outermembrane recepter protein [Ulvibacter litoralis]